MIPPGRNRTTSAPGLVDLPTPRRPSKEVALERKKKDDAAATKAEAKRLAAARVAELESSQAIAALSKKARTNQLGPKQARKRPVMSTSLRDTQVVTPQPAPNTVLVKNTSNTSGKKRKADEQSGTTVAKKKKKGGPRAAVPSKPRGFQHLINSPPTPEEPVVVTDDDDTLESDTEDELGYHGNDSSPSMVSITSSSTTDPTSDQPSSRPGVRDLPEALKRSFADTFVPCVISSVGCSSTPWRRVEVGVLQRFFTFVYPNHDLAIAKGDELESPTNARVMSFRNAIAKRATENVLAYMKRFSVDETETYVASAFSYHQEIPFLYQTFQRTDQVEPDLRKEPGGYKVIRRGLFRHHVILQTMLVYYRQIRSDVDTARRTGIHPVGALALVCAAVGRAIRMHKSGTFIADPIPFSEKDWGRDTRVYSKLINDLSESRWASFYSALKLTEEFATELKEYSKADMDRPLEDEPEDYHIRDSDPVGSGEDAELEYE